MQPALGFRRTTPSPGTFVFAGLYGAGARLAADARIILVMQWIVRNLLANDSLPNVLLRPACQGADFDEAELLVPLYDRRIGPRGALVAADARGPGVIVRGYAVQYDDLAIVAATVRIAGIDRPAMQPLIVQHAQFGPLQVDVNAILFIHPFTQFERFAKLIAGVEIEDIDPGLDSRQHGNDHASLGPQAGCHGKTREVPLDRPGKDFLRAVPLQTAALFRNPLQFFGAGRTNHRLSGRRLNPFYRFLRKHRTPVCPCARPILGRGNTHDR